MDDGVWTTRMLADYLWSKWTTLPSNEAATNSLLFLLNRILDMDYYDHEYIIYIYLPNLERIQQPHLCVEYIDVAL